MPLAVLSACLSLHFRVVIRSVISRFSGCVRICARYAVPKPVLCIIDFLTVGNVLSAFWGMI